MNQCLMQSLAYLILELSHHIRGSCGHVFVLNCGASGIAADGLLVNNGMVTEDPSCKLNEKEGSKVRFYEAESTNNMEKLVPLLGSFLDQSAEHFRGQWSNFKRGKPLIALDPTVFIGSELDDTVKLTILSDLMRKIYSVVDDFGVDVAVCIPEGNTFRSTLELREELCPFSKGPFWMLSDGQKAEASKLADLASVGRLSIFIGAGISIPSGAPSWGGLLEILAIKAGMDEDDRKSLKELSFLDQPTILAEDMGDDFKPAIAEIVNSSSRYTPAHALLKSLKSPAITTNYDALYETAAKSCNQYIPTLPWDSRKMINDNHEESNSILKLHGCVKYPKTIVLSREDYLRYPDNYQALRGRLHGIFLTSKVLFCGFSMTDDNVHTIIDQIRKVLYIDDKNTKDNFGTILTMTENKMFNRLWDQDFDIHSFGKSWSDNPAWYHDCFLDYMVASFVVQED